MPVAATAAGGDTAPAAAPNGDGGHGGAADMPSSLRRRRDASDGEATAGAGASAAKRSRARHVCFDQSPGFEATWSCELLGGDNPDRGPRLVEGVLLGEADEVDREPEDIDLRHCDRCCVALLADLYACLLCEARGDDSFDLCPECFAALEAAVKGARRRKKAWHPHAPTHFRLTRGDACDTCGAPCFVRQPPDGSGMIPPYVTNPACTCHRGEGAGAGATGTVQQQQVAEPPVAASVEVAPSEPSEPALAAAPAAPGETDGAEPQCAQQ